MQIARTEASQPGFPLEDRPVLPPGSRVEICGPIGAGKSTLARFLVEHGAVLVPEPVETHPFLARFYADPGRHFFEKALHFLLDYVHRLKALEGHEAPLVFDAGAVVHCAFLDLGEFSPEEEASLREFEQLIRESCPPADLTLRLTCPTDTLLRRIRQRGRDFEAGVDHAMLEALDRAMDRAAARHVPEGRLLRLDSSRYDFALPNAEAAAVISHIVARLGGEIPPSAAAPQDPETS